MLASLLVILMIAGFALYQYTKGGTVNSFIFLVAVISAVTAALNYYEPLASYMIGYSFIGAKSFAIAFIALFFFVFIAVREISNMLLKSDLSFGGPIDKFVGVGVGAMVGYIFSGAILIAIALIPYKTTWLYSRFDDKIDNPPSSKGALFNPDAFVTKLFGWFSSGSLQGQNSFAVSHADFIDQLFLNRLQVSESISPIAGGGAVSIVPHGVRFAPENLVQAPKQEEKAQPVETPSGKLLVLVGLRISPSSLAPTQSDQPKLSLSQLRLVFSSGEVAYPIGYINPERQLVLTPLTAVLGDELKEGKIDFAFYIPKDAVPAALEFRQNIIEKINRVEPAEEIAPVKPADVTAPNEPAPPQADSNQISAEPNS